MSYPIAGNQNFTKVENLAGQLNVANIRDANVSDLQADLVATSIQIQLPFEATKVKSLDVVAPSAFGNLADGSTTLPLVLPGNTATPLSSSDPSCAKVPEESTVVAVVFNNNGVEVSGTSAMNLGLGAFNTAGNNLVAGTTDATINQTGVVQSMPSGSQVLGGNGGKPTGTPAGVGVNFLTLTNVTGPNTAGGFGATVYYIE